MSFFSGFRPQHWKRSYSHKRKSAFGGEVKSHAEVKALNKSIREQEAQELRAFEEKFDEAWREAHSPRKKES